MNKTVKKAFVVSSVTLFSVTAFAFVAHASHSWGSYHWARTSNPFTLKLGDNVSTLWDSYLGTISSEWSQSSVLDTLVVPGSTDPRRCKPTSGNIQVCNAKYGKNGWLGIAQIWATGSHITQGVTKLNDTYFNTPFYNTTGWRSLVMCQEIGHVFGLDHQDEDFNNVPIEPRTCMDYFVPGANEWVGPNQHDLDQLALLYEHLDTVNTIAANEPQGANRKPSDIDLENPSEWGRSVKKDARGRDNLFVKDLSGGRKIFTHVFWAE